MNTQPVNFAKILLPLVIATTLGAIGPSVAIADIININPIKDNTLYEYDPTEGDVAQATPNDATWRHRFFDTIFWTTEGGDFSATVSASQSVGAVGMYMWSSPQMIGDVQSWLNNPTTNFGWLVLGDESDTLTAKRFDTRESASPPVLTIQYTPGVPRPTPTPRPRATPRSRPTPSAFSHPLLFLSRLCAMLPAD